MHRPLPDDDPTTDIQCTGCHRNLWPDELTHYTCRACRNRAATHLATITTLWPRLNTTGALTPTTQGPSAGRRAPNGAHTAPLPLRLHPLTLTATGGVSTRLQAIEDSWRAARGRRLAPWAGSPHQAVTAHLAFLRINLDWACESYPEIAQDIDELRRLANEMTTALDPGPSSIRIQIGSCPALPDDATTPCGTPLTASTSTHSVRCDTCGTRWDGLTAWTDLRTAQTALTRRALVAA
jgi:hypothetical protein